MNRPLAVLGDASARGDGVSPGDVVPRAGLDPIDAGEARTGSVP